MAQQIGGMRGLRRDLPHDGAARPQSDDRLLFVWEGVNPFLPSVLQKVSAVFCLRDLLVEVDRRGLQLP